MCLCIHSSFRVLATSFNDLFRCLPLSLRGEFQARNVAELFGIPRTQRMAWSTAGAWGWVIDRAKERPPDSWERPLVLGSARRAQTELLWNPGLGKPSCHPEILDVPRGV